MRKILLIGAGQLGSRYLQGLAKIKEPVSIDVVETSEKAIEIAKMRYAEVSPNSTNGAVRYWNDLGNVEQEYDLAILATNSDVRASLVRALLQKSKVSNLILEKVVFQRVRDFEEIGKLLQEKKVCTWVNFPRRACAFYQTLREWFQEMKQPITYSVFGTDWGLGSSCLHFIDHLAFLSGNSQFEIDTAGLDRKIHNSRRPGFVELYGLLRGKSSGGDRIFLYSGEGPANPFLVTIFNESMNVVLDENLGVARIARKERNWSWEEHSFRLLYQSEFTPLVVEEIFEKRTSPLTSFSEAADLHRPVLVEISRFLEEVGKKVLSACPIT